MTGARLRRAGASSTRSRPPRPRARPAAAGGRAAARADGLSTSRRRGDLRDVEAFASRPPARAASVAQGEPPCPTADAPAVGRDRRPRPDQRRTSYAAMYAASVADPEAFWGEQGKRLDWIEAVQPGEEHLVRLPRRVDQVVRGRQAQRLGQLHRPPPRDAAASRPRSSGRATTRTSREQISYRQLHERGVEVRQRAARRSGSSKGDRVVLYLPMIPEAAYAMLACTRIGAVHSIVFAGFSADALRSRIEDSGAKLVITADEAPRGGRRTPAQGQRRQGAGRACRRAPARRAAHRRRGALGREPRRLAARGDGAGLRPLRAGGDERRGPALHPLHLAARPASPRASSTPPAAISSTPR